MKFETITLPTISECEEYLKLNRLNILHRFIYNCEKDLYKSVYDYREALSELLCTEFYFNVWYNCLYGYRYRIIDLGSGQFQGEIRDKNDTTLLSIMNNDYNIIKKELIGRYKFLTKNK